jgi:VanZ family protein
VIADPTTPWSADRRWTAALALGVALGVGVLQREWWQASPSIDLLARETSRAWGVEASVERRTGGVQILGDPGLCPADGGACPDAVLEWTVPVSSGFVEVGAHASGDADLGKEAWVRVNGLHGGTALRGRLPAEGRAVVPVGRDPVVVQIRYRDARGVLDVDRLVLTPLDERRRASAVRGATWLGWMLLGSRVCRDLAYEASSRVRGGLLAAALGVVWLGLSGPSIEWIELRLGDALASEAPVQTTPAPEVRPPPRPSPPTKDVPRKRDLVPVDPFMAFHGVGFFAVGVLFVRARVRTWAPIVLLAPASELVQGVLPGRTGRADDVVVDLLGLAAGVGAALGVRWWRGRSA